METVTLDLSNLSMHHLDVVPRESENAIEFQLHATLGGLDERVIEAAANKKLQPQTLTASVQEPSP